MWRRRGDPVRQVEVERAVNGERPSMIGGARRSRGSDTEQLVPASTVERAGTGSRVAARNEIGRVAPHEQVMLLLVGAVRPAVRPSESEPVAGCCGDKSRPCSGSSHFQPA